VEVHAMADEARLFAVYSVSLALLEYNPAVYTKTRCEDEITCKNCNAGDRLQETAL
jgi:hypothetical protein